MYQLKATKASYRTLVALYADPPEDLAKLEFFADKPRQNCELHWRVDKCRCVARLRYLDGACSLVCSLFERDKSAGWLERERTVHRPSLLELRDLGLLREYAAARSFPTIVPKRSVRK